MIIVNRRVSPWFDSFYFFEANGQSYEYYANSDALKNAKVKRIVYPEQPNVFILVKQKETNDFHLFSPLNEENDTVETLLEDLERLEKVTVLLDKGTPGRKNWRHFAWKLDISRDDCDKISLTTKEYPSPSRKLMQFIVQVYPGLTMRGFVRTLVKMERRDVINVLKKHCCGKILMIT